MSVTTRVYTGSKRPQNLGEICKFSETLRGWRKRMEWLLIVSPIDNQTDMQAESGVFYAFLQWPVSLLDHVTDESSVPAVTFTCAEPAAVCVM